MTTVARRATLKPSRKMLFVMSSVTVLVVAAAAVPVRAQTEKPAGADVGEVVVTARKREERLRDIPMAATALSAATLEQRAAVDTAGAIVNSSPGVRFNDLGTSTLSEISIRASGTAQNTNADTPTGLYANGVYVQGGLQFTRNFARIDFFDLGRAEVLRGTQGALLGRNAVGGAISLISAQPTFNDYSGRVQLDWGPEIDKKDVQIISNLGVSDSLAFRLGVDLIDQDKGLFHNISTGQYFDEQKGQIARAQARYAKGPFDGTLLIEAQELRIPTASFRENIAPGIAGFPLGYLGRQFEYTQNGGGDGHQNVEQIQFLGSYDLGWGDLSGTTSYRHRYTRFYGDQDGFDPAELALIRAAGNPAPTQAVYATQRLADDTFLGYFDLHLAGKKTGKLSWLAGVELLRTDTSYNTHLNLTGGSTTMLTPQESHQKLLYISEAYYGSLGYDITDQLNVTGELRYTHDHKRYRIYVLGGPNFLFSNPPVLSTITQAITLRHYDNSNVDYNLTASWKFASRWMAYAKTGTGYRAGGFNSGVDPPPPAIPPRPTQPTYNAENTVSYEVGAKGNLLSDLYVTLAAYKNVTSNVLTAIDNGCAPTVPQCPSRGSTFLTNTGEAHVWGVEAEANLHYALFGGDGTVTVTGSRQKGSYHDSALAGLAVPQAPDWVASAELYYQHPLPHDLTGFMNWDYRGQWGGYQTVTVPLFQLDDFQIVDVRAGVRRGPVEFAGYVSNLFNDHYKLFIAAANFREAPPFSWGLQLRYKW